MQPVVGEVFHPLEGFGVDAGEFPAGVVVGYGHADGVERADGVGCKLYCYQFRAVGIGRAARLVADGACQWLGVVIRLDSSIKPGGHVGDVEGVYEVVAVDVADADVAFEVGVATAQTGVVGVGSEVGLIHFAVGVDVAGEICFGARHFEYVEFASADVTSHSFVDVETYVACLWLLGEHEFFVEPVAFPAE